MALAPEKLLRLARVAALVRRAAKAYDASPVAVWRRAQHLYERDGFRMREVAVLGLLDPALPEERIDKLVSERRLRAVQLRLSPASLSAVTDDKALFYFACALAALPVPPVHALLYRGLPGWTRLGETPLTRGEWAKALLRTLPESFVSKPARADHGEGIRLFRREGERFFEKGYELGDAGALYDSLLADSPHAGFVLQERARNAAFLSRLSGSEALQTLRVVTLLEEGRRVSVLAAALKVVARDALVDNFGTGASGNGTSAVELQTGELRPIVLARADGFGLYQATSHPRTALPYAGVVLPGFAEALALARRAAHAFFFLRTIGWDIALTPSGPLLVEANTCWVPFNHVWPGALLLRRLEEALATPPAGEREELEQALAGRTRAARDAGNEWESVSAAPGPPVESAATTERLPEEPEE